MIDLDFTFDEVTPWEAFLQTKQVGDSICAIDMLTILEGEDEQAVEDALQQLEEGSFQLDLTGMPRNPGTGEAALRLRREQELAENGMDFASLPENDPLRLYLQEIAGIPVCGDEQLLAESRKEDDEETMLKLTNLGLSRVVRLAQEHTGYGVLLLDLMQEGSLGLWQAIRNFGEGDYADYRDRWIRFYMARAIALQARNNGIGQKMRRSLEDYRAVDERLLSELGRNPTVEEIALELHMTVEETEVVKKMLENARILAKVQKPRDEEEEKQAEGQAVEDTALFQMRQRILDLLSSLSPEDAKLLTLRFGLEGGLPLNPEDTGKKMNLTPQEVVRREAAALALLRNNQ